jgi:hypothetical protein
MHNTENTNTVFTDAKIFAYLRDFVLASKPDAEPSDKNSILSKRLRRAVLTHIGTAIRRRLPF